MPATFTWTTDAGVKLEFQVREIRGDWDEAGGIYALASRSELDNGWDVFWVGKTESFRDRKANHAKELAAVAAGATHILTVVEPDERRRASMQSLLVRKLNPPLNFQASPIASLWAPLRA